MIVPILILMISMTGVGLALFVPGLTDLIILAGPCALAGLLLVLGAFFRGHRLRLFPVPEWVVVDGSNVMHWKGGTPDIAPVREVVDHLSRLGLTPGVVFDANAGHKLGGRYQDNRALAKALGMPPDRVTVVRKGTPADPAILAASRDLRGRIVTNDRFRDWAEAYPEAGKAGHLIRGGYRSGKLWLDVPDPRSDQSRMAIATTASALTKKPGTRRRRAS